MAERLGISLTANLLGNAIEESTPSQGALRMYVPSLDTVCLTPFDRPLMYLDSKVPIA